MLHDICLRTLHSQKLAVLATHHVVHVFCAVGGSEQSILLPSLTWPFPPSAVLSPWSVTVSPSRRSHQHGWLLCRQPHHAAAVHAGNSTYRGTGPWHSSSGQVRSNGEDPRRLGRTQVRTTAVSPVGPCRTANNPRW